MTEKGVIPKFPAKPSQAHSFTLNPTWYPKKTMANWQKKRKKAGSASNSAVDLHGPVFNAGGAANGNEKSSPEAAVRHASGDLGRYSTDASLPAAVFNDTVKFNADLKPPSVLFRG